MSQFGDPYANPYMNDPAAQPKKTSGLAITALVFSLIGIIPCLGLVMAPLGVLLGLIGAVTLGPAALKKGRGMAVAAIIVGGVFFVGQVLVTKMGYDFIYGFVKQVMDGPRLALESGTRGDIAGFKAQFHGAGATATDAEAKEFLDSLRDRYGTFQSCKFDESSGRPTKPQPGQANVPFPYVLTFSTNTVKAETEVIFADQRTGTLLKKIGYIIVFDPAGDLEYPPGASSSGATRGSTRSPSGKSAPGISSPPAGTDTTEGADKPDGGTSGGAN